MHASGGSCVQHPTSGAAYPTQRTTCRWGCHHYPPDPVPVRHTATVHETVIQSAQQTDRNKPCQPWSAMITVPQTVQHIASTSSKDATEEEEIWKQLTEYCTVAERLAVLRTLQVTSAVTTVSSNHTAHRWSASYLPVTHTLTRCARCAAVPGEASWLICMHRCRRWSDTGMRLPLHPSSCRSCARTSTGSGCSSSDGGG